MKPYVVYNIRGNNVKIYNSLTRQKEVFVPLEAGKVKIYVCGPTVYDYAHIGNARTYAAFDVMVRYFKWQGYQVTYVRNITDIDDKIIKRANENQEAFTAVVERFTHAIHDDFAALGLLKPDDEPRATAYIPQIVNMISALIAKEVAYVASNGDVYYQVRRFETYGQLSHRNIDQLESGARIEINDVKRDPLDFVLWKLAKPNEPSWSSPWGEGRPGWHIECSAMSTTILSSHFDIHGGGKDLIFPHHENEIAQSEAACGQKFVNYWMHAGYLQIDKEKMSKSLGNFFTIRDVLKTYSPEILRFFLINGHYRSPVQYSANVLRQAASALERLYTALRSLPAADPLKETVFEQQFIAAMDDDFNTPLAFSVLFELAHEIQRERLVDLQKAAQLGALLKLLGGVLGILQSDPDAFLKGENLGISSDEIEQLIQARNTARAEKNWTEADRIRKTLSDLSIILEDGPTGTTWKKS